MCERVCVRVTQHRCEVGLGCIQLWDRRTTTLISLWISDRCIVLMETRDYEETPKRRNETAGIKKQNTETKDSCWSEDVQTTVTIWWRGHTDAEWQNFPREKLSDEHRSSISNFHPQSFTFRKQIQVQPSDTWPSLCICSCYWLKSPDKSQHKQQVGGSESLEEGTLAGFKLTVKSMVKL